jgi:hypothetical protein
MKSPGLGDFIDEFYQTFKGLMPILLKLSQRIERKETFPTLFYEASIILMPKTEKDSTK